MNVGVAGKRTFDIVVGVALCLLALPLIGALALALAVQHRSNPFFVHDRVGLRGMLMSVPKLRTLRAGTPIYADKTVLALDPPTPLAAALRRFHLDELPQLFLVPLGRMSLVGPRPRMATEREQCGDERYEAVRTSVRQGCTGLWQISQGKADRVSDHPEYDFFYVEQHTLRLDVWVLWRTLRQTFGGGAISLADIPRWALRQPDRWSPRPASAVSTGPELGAQLRWMTASNSSAILSGSEADSA